MSMTTIRPATADDIEAIEAIERVCFPAEEAASLAAFHARFSVFPECFFVLEVAGEIVGHINGCVYDKPALPDALYADATLHCPNGAYQTVFGLAVALQHQRKGYASLLMQHFIDISRERGRQGVFLTCKDYLKPLYESQGFVSQGVSDSTHGGAQWNDMLLVLNPS